MKSFPYSYPLSVDLKAEVLLWLWLSEGLDYNEVVVHPKGAFKRAYARDVERVWVEEPAGNTLLPSRLHVEVNRDGLYEALPEGLFHQPTRRKPDRSTLEIVEEIKIQQNREAAARKFFLPLEQEFYHLRLLFTAEEQKQYVHAQDSRIHKGLMAFWDIPPLFNPRQLHYLFHLLPLMHRIVHDQAAIVQCLQLFVEENIVLRNEYVAAAEIPDQVAPSLGRALLGVDTVIAGWYPERIAVVGICVVLEKADCLSEYLPGGKKWQILQYLTDYLLPCEVEQNIRVEIASPHDAWELSGADATGRLGYSTTL